MIEKIPIDVDKKAFELMGKGDIIILAEKINEIIDYINNVRKDAFICNHSNLKKSVQHPNISECMDCGSLVINKQTE
jgi:hypothetical protein